MKLFSLLIPSLFIVTSVYAQDSVTPLQPSQEEVRRDLLAKIETAVHDHNDGQIEVWSKDPSMATSLTKQDLKPLLDKCAAQVKWTDYVKKTRDTVGIISKNILLGALIIPPVIALGGIGVIEEAIGLKNLGRNTFLVAFALGFTGVELCKQSPTKNETLLTYIAMKKLYNAVPNGVSPRQKK